MPEDAVRSSEEIERAFKNKRELYDLCPTYEKLRRSRMLELLGEIREIRTKIVRMEEQMLKALG